jgi:hypothetical protein
MRPVSLVWQWRGYLQAGADRLAQLLARTADDDGPQHTSAIVYPLGNLGRLALLEGDIPAAQRSFAHCVGLARQSGNRAAPRVHRFRRKAAQIPCAAPTAPHENCWSAPHGWE